MTTDAATTPTVERKAPKRSNGAAGAKAHISTWCAMGSHERCTSKRCTCSHHAVSGNGSGTATAAVPDSGNRDTGVSQTTSSLAVLRVEQLVPGRNPRRNLGELEGLAASIRAVGIIEPLVVEPAGPGSYRLIAGHRRLAAARLVGGLEALPCIVRDEAGTDATRLELALIENLQREGLAPLDEADGYNTLVGLGLSQRSIAERVGCSQSHVSKRLALLELPKPVLKRVGAGTLPLEAAAALLRLKDHPSHLKEVAGYDPSTIAFEVERAERRIAYEAKLAELADTARDKGWSLVEEPAWNAKRKFKTLAHWNGPPELDVDPTAHAAEPCQGIMLPAAAGYTGHFGRKPTATSVCLDPARHGPKGDSALKVKAPAKPKPTSHEVRQREEAKARKDAAEARAVVLADALSSHRATRGPTPPRVVMCLRAWVDVGRYQHGATACALLGLGDVPSHVGALERLADTDDGLHKAALAITLARVEGQLKSSYFSSWEDEGVRAHYELLAGMGYEPTPWERSKLEVARRATGPPDVETAAAPVPSAQS